MNCTELSWGLCSGVEISSLLISSHLISVDCFQETKLLPHQQAFRGLCVFSVNCTFLWKLSSFYLIKKVTRRPPSRDYVNPLFLFHSVEHTCGLLQPHGTLLKYLTVPHADLFFHCMQSRTRIIVSKRNLGLKRNMPQARTSTETAKGNHQLPLSVFSSLDICGSDFHFHKYFKTFVLFCKTCTNVKCTNP